MMMAKSDSILKIATGNEDYSLEEAKNLSLKSKDFKFCVELPIKAKRSGYKLVNSKAHERSRIGGKKKVNPFRDGFIILIYLIKLFFVSIISWASKYENL